MTPPSTSGSLGRMTSSPRMLAVWTLLTLAGLYLIFAFLNWIFPSGPSSFSDRSAGAFHAFISVVTVAAPVLAVLLAVHVEPLLANSKLVAMVACIEYVVALFFGLITLLIGLGSVFDIGVTGSAVYSFGRALNGLGYLVVGIVWLVLTGIAALVSYHAYTALGGRLPTSRPTPAPPAPPAP